MDFLNNKEIEWKDVDLSFSGAKMGKGIGFTLDIDVDLQHLFAAGNEAISIQAGNKSISGTLRVLKGVLDDITTAAVAAGGSDATDIEFDLTVVFKAYGQRPIKTLLVTGCRISKISYSMSQGDKEMPVDLPFLALQLKAA